MSDEAEEAVKSPRVFVSYSHDSEEHARRVLALADRLRQDGVDAWLDQYELEPEQGWEQWMIDELEAADRVLVVCTETYRRRFEGQEKKRGLGARWEGAIITGKLYRREELDVSPVVFVPEDLEHLPTALKQGLTHHVLTDESGYERLYRVLTRQPTTLAPPLGTLKSLPPVSQRGLQSSSVVLLGALQSLAAPQRRWPFDDEVPAFAHDEPPESPVIGKYRRWAQKTYATLDLLGLGAGDLKVDLERIYVPLRVGDRPTELSAGKRGRARAAEGWLRAGAGGTIELDRLFLLPAAPGDSEPRHALIFGAPGSGKTTALKKLHQLALGAGGAGARALGLAAGTLPVFLRLRRFTPALLAEGLEAFVAAELEELSGGKLDGAAKGLWSRGRLLLLFDGLDEIADEGHRAKVLERIVWRLKEPELAGVRAVVSCRSHGEDAVSGVATDGFRRFDVRAFEDSEIARLIELWFQEMARAKYLERAEATDHAARLIEALAERRQQQFLRLISTPLHATLLCIVVMRGGEIPRRRVEFFEECLRILVREWRRKQARRDPPVLPERAFRVLEALAWTLHSGHRRDDLTYPQALKVLKRELEDRRLARRVFRWLLEDVGLLDRYTGRHYGFAHLSFQEHLAARHLEARLLAGDEQPLDAACLEWEDSWWHEVLRLLAGLPRGRAFAPLLGRLLAAGGLEGNVELLRDCLAEASDPDLEPFYELLEGGAPAATKATALGLLRGRREPRLLELAERLAGDAEGSDAQSERALAAMARQVIERASRDAATSGAQAAADVFLLHGGADLRPARKLATALRGHGLTVERPKRSREWDDHETAERIYDCRKVLVLLGEEPLDADRLEDLLDQADDGEALLLSLPGDPRPAVPEPLAHLPQVDLPSLSDREALAALAERLRAPAPTEPAAAGDPELGPEQPLVAGAPAIVSPTTERFTEPLTGEVFLRVPREGAEGRFEMGARGITNEELPIHPVRLTPFWLARTPVTNRQYQLFLEATAHQEPSFWRDERFSDPEQPVVGVSWHDALAYCAWLDEASARRPRDHVFTLPTEAQWEYAARGDDSWEYPWGIDRRPDPELATFGQNYGTGKPSPVGSHPAGKGPFGHLDLAGNVWEWCRDLWEPGYERWKGEEPLDPIGEADDSRRPLRGGSWWVGAEYLRSADRYWLGPGVRYDSFGFRVSCSSSSTVR